MRFPCAVLAALWIGLSGAAASAGEVTIQFDFTGSTLSILGGIITIPPGGGARDGPEWKSASTAVEMLFARFPRRAATPVSVGSESACA